MYRKILNIKPISDLRNYSEVFIYAPKALSLIDGAIK